MVKNLQERDITQITTKVDPVAGMQTSSRPDICVDLVHKLHPLQEGLPANNLFPATKYSVYDHLLRIRRPQNRHARVRPAGSASKHDDHEARCPRHQSATTAPPMVTVIDPKGLTTV